MINLEYIIILPSATSTSTKYCLSILQDEQNYQQKPFSLRSEVTGQLIIAVTDIFRDYTADHRAHRVRGSRFITYCQYQSQRWI